MTTLTYRGKNYVQNKEASKRQLVELTYRKNVYTLRQEKVSQHKNKHKLCYRGVFHKD